MLILKIRLSVRNYIVLIAFVFNIQHGNIIKKKPRKNNEKQLAERQGKRYRDLEEK